MSRALLLTVPVLMVMSLACQKVGVELPLAHRPAVEGFEVTLHARDADRFQVVVSHPRNHFYNCDQTGVPWQAKLLGDPQHPFTTSKTAFTYTEQSSSHSSLLGGRVTSTNRVETGTTTARTVWSFDRARWAEGRPFRLVFIRGFAPITEEKRMELEITLGAQVGSAGGRGGLRLPRGPLPRPQAMVREAEEEARRLSEGMPQDVKRYLELRITGSRPRFSASFSTVPLKTTKGSAPKPTGKETVDEEGQRLRQHYAGELAVIQALDEAERYVRDRRGH